MQTKKVKVIYFIDGPVPTAEQRVEADRLTTAKQAVVFRNNRYTDEGGLEKCDFVAGLVTPRYKDHPIATTPDAATGTSVPPSPDPVGEPTEADVLAFRQLPIEQVIKQVTEGAITAERAAVLEKLGNNRVTLLKRLAALPTEPAQS